MYQHVFWFYSHPAVYIMMLPGFGIISEVISTHARKPVTSHKFFKEKSGCLTYFQRIFLVVPYLKVEQR